MKTIVLAARKGGAGKTTLAASLAVAAEAADAGPVVLLDMDPQGSLTAWWNTREDTSPALAISTVPALAEKLQALADAGAAVVVIDTPPAITEQIRNVVKLADLVVSPTRPSPHDLRAVGSTVELVQEAGKPFLFALTQAKPNARLTIQAVAALSEHGMVAPVIVHDRVDYAASMIDGRTVSEADPKSKSAGEISALWAIVQARLHDKKKTRKLLNKQNSKVIM